VKAQLAAGGPIFDHYRRPERVPPGQPDDRRKQAELLLRLRDDRKSYLRASPATRPSWPRTTKPNATYAPSSCQVSLCTR
jgi:hypothetical protein